MTTPMKVDDVAHTIRDLVNNRRRLALLIRDQPAAFSQACSALDTLGDTEYAVSAYSRAPTKTDAGDNYLLIYGILQVLFVQQDAAESLAKALSVKFTRDRVLSDIRRTRAMSIGHPTSHDYGRAFSFIDRGSMSKTGFHLRTRFADGTPPREQWIDIPDMIERQREALCLLLSTVVAELETREQEHYMAFRGTRLQDCMLSVLDYYFEKMYQAVRENELAFGASHVQLVQKAIDDLERLVAERDPAGGWAAFPYEFEQIRYPLAELLDYFSADGPRRLRPADADIFISFAQSRMHTLRAMAIEIDDEYSDNASNVQAVDSQ